MNAWIVAAAVLLVSVLVPLFVCARRPLMDALVALELSGVLMTVTLMLLAEGFHRGALFDPALILAVMTFIGSLTYVRLMERRL